MNKKVVVGLISILLISAIVITAFAPAFAASEGIDSEDTKNQTSIKETDRNYYYLTIFGNVIASFSTTIHDESGERTVTTYPADYAGAYIDQSNNLHIVLTKNATTAATENDYLKVAGDTDIIFETGDFSLSRLYEIQDALDHVMKKFRIESTVPNEMTNKLEIHLLDSTKQTDVVEFLKTEFSDFDDRCVIFMGPVGIRGTAADTTSNALAGSNTDYISGPAGTIGFNAYRHATGQFGMVTAAHVATSGTTMKNEMGTTIGSATVRAFSDGGNVDAAFVPFPAAITKSYEISCFPMAGFDYITGYYPNAYNLLGATVSKFGRTTGITSGTVTAVGVSVYWEDIDMWFNDQLQLSNTQLEGDSGAPVIVNGPVPPVGQVRLRTLVGIATFSDSSNLGYVSRVENVMNALGISPYHYNP